jgi:hypothetical protein
MSKFLASSLFVNCKVNCHKDLPRHIWNFFQALGIQFRWVLTRGAISRTLVALTTSVLMTLKKLPG